MNRTFRRITAAALAFSCLALGACSKKEEEKQSEEPISAKDLETIHELEFGGVYVKITIDDFNALGFEYGDSVNVTFSNDYTLEDIPYYNGYYVDAGEPLVISYPGYDYVKVAVNYGDDLYVTAGLDENSTASIVLNEQGKYADIQAARDIHYTDFRKDYPSDEVFANFRNMKMGNIRENILYRSASPCDNQHNRAPYVDDLIEQVQVNCILNLSDNVTKIENYIAKEDFDSPYFLSLYEAGNVIPLALSMNYLSDDFSQKIAQGFIAMTEKEGPYLIHCTEGKDRTGFVCMLIEALCGADYQSIADDYMVTYDNYYQINQQKEPEKYKTILEKNLDAMLKTVVGDDSVDIKTADLAPYARNYLKNAGMSDEQIDELLLKITE